MPIPLVNSERRRALPAINLATSVIVNPADWAGGGWPACFAANLTKQQFLCMPSYDYRSMGEIMVDNKAGGSPGAPKVVRYYNGGIDDNVHPVKRVGGNEARCERIIVRGAASTYWHFYGLTFRVPIDVCIMQEACSNIVFDHLLIEESFKYSCRVRGVTNCVVQCCVIRNANNSTGVPASAPGDSTGIQVGNIDFDVTGIELIDNEIYNCGDSIQYTDGPQPWRPVEVINVGNCLYVEPSWYIGNTNTTYLENGIDIKAGSSRPDSNLIEDNRMWGFRGQPPAPPQPTARGEALVIQKLARNGRARRNIIGDCPQGMKDENWVTTQMNYTADVTTNILTSVSATTGLPIAHTLTNGAGPYKVTTTGTCPVNLNTADEFYAIKLTTTTFQLATSEANATAATPIPVVIGSNGTGTNRFRISSEAKRNWIIEENQFYDIRDYASVDAGSVFLPICNIQYLNNIVARSSYLCGISPTVYHGPPVITGNTLREVGAIQRPEKQTPALPFDPAMNTNLSTPVFPVVYDVYERKRWTGPEWAICATVVTQEVAPPPPRSRTTLVAVPSPKRQAVRYGAARRTARR